MTDTIASFILALPAWVALLVVFALPALESSAFVGFVFPGEIALILGGVLAFQGRVSLVAVLVAGIAGAIIGDSVGYLVGRRYGRGVLEGTLGRFINHKHFDRAETYLAERGGKAVFLGRFTAALRVMIPGLSGMSRMHYPTFVAYNVAGGVVWGAMCVLLGYVGGSSWRRVEHLASRIGLGVLAVVIVLAAIGFLLHKTRGPWVRAQMQRLQRSRATGWAIARYPRQVRWLVGRLDPHPRTGLLLTVAVAATVASTWTFLGVTQDVRAHEELALLDPRIHAWIAAHRIGWLTTVMRVVTWLGANEVLLPSLLMTGILLSRRRRSWTPTATLLVVYGWALILYALVLDLVHRPRPPATGHLTDAIGWSYPSGHTLQATAGWGIACLLLLPALSPRGRSLMAAGWAAVVLLVGTSRVYLGTSWLSDVLAGACLGIALLGLYEITRRTIYAATDEDEPATSNARPQKA